MVSFLAHRAKEMTNITDEVIVNDILATGSALANVYLNATITSPTPELRTLYGKHLQEIIGGHSATIDLAVNKGWENPYQSTSQLLIQSFERSKEIISKPE